MYRARLDVVTSARQRASILYTLATLSELCLNQPDTALIYYGQYREIYPDDIHAIHNIARLAHKIGDWKKVIEMLLIERDSAGSIDERCELLIKIADICQYKLNKPQYAITFLIQAKKELWKVLSLLIPVLYFGYFGVNSSRAWPWLGQCL